MGRKNVRAQGRGRAQAKRSPWGDVPAPVHRPVTDMPRVEISGRCPAPKARIRYATEATALKALKTIRADRQHRGHPESSIEKRVYECQITGCGGWHLTSRTEWSPIPGRQQ